MIFPEELASFIVEQNYDKYTYEDFEVWGKIFNQQSHLLKTYFNDIDPAYIFGFSKLGVSSNNIPSIMEINRALQTVDWTAVCVDGYLPASAYTHFISRRIFPVSRNIRHMRHIEHSPMPDLIHDIIGHLPMLFTKEYRDFLLQIASLIYNTRGNHLDEELFEANLELALLKEGSQPSDLKIQSGLQKIEYIQSCLKMNPSILTQLNRMFLWSIEFGLIGTIENHKCFGAGMLSSPTELQTVLQRKTKLLSYSIDVINYDINFVDIQNQFFVAKNYKHLTDVLKQFEFNSKNMAI